MAKQTPVKHIKLSEETVALIEQRVFSLIEPLLPATFYLLAVCVEKEGPYWLLQVFIEVPVELPSETSTSSEKPLSISSQGISLQDCEVVSRILNTHWESIEASLQKEMPLLKDWAYNLEVSSPGLFRPLKTKREFEFYQGFPIRVEKLEPALAQAPGAKTNNATPKLSIAQKKAPVATEITRGTLAGYEPETQTVLVKPDNSNETQTIPVQLDNQTQVLLNPIIRLEDEDSVPVTL
ncbi:MAG: hypothetical protein VKJ04_06275 [Vampirovibrionales bacterium]|nr:hypothetical protein [Vampirovibrionales bacterium]